jgi:hypothetical protein
MRGSIEPAKSCNDSPMRKFPATGGRGVALCAALLAACAGAAAQPGGGGGSLQGFERLTLERGGCYGYCPIYRIVIAADGRTEYWGERNVKVEGIHVSQLGADALRQLKALVNEVGFFDLRDRYDSKEAGCTSVATDSPTVQVSVRAGGRLKSLEHYLGCGGPVGARLARFEDAIDRIAATAAWVGTPQERERQWQERMAAGERRGSATPAAPIATAAAPIAIPADVERGRPGRDIVRFYRSAARSGNCAAARRLGKIYAGGVLADIPRDYSESLYWRQQADRLGCGASNGKKERSP